ncbi:MAG: hypothetical protein V4534_06800 [Myxococcota bacterium]
MRFFHFRLMGSLLFSMGTLAAPGYVMVPQIREISLPVEHIYILSGFDSNDAPELFVSGWYANPCQEWGRAIIYLDRDSQKIDINLKALSRDSSDAVCINMAVPYLESIKLGSLSSGTWALAIGDRIENLPIIEAESSSIDEHLYGQVRHVTSSDDELTLHIELPSSCIELDRIEAIYNGKNACAILPIMKKVKEHCPRDPRMKEYSYTIPEAYLTAEKVLFHVRSLEGKSVNHLYSR